MKKISSIFLISAVIMSVLSTAAMADPYKGKKFYIKKLKACKKDGIKDGAAFASKHDRATWKIVKDNGNLINHWKELCPSATKRFDKMKPKHIDNLYDFVLEFASDGEEASCD